MIRISATHIVAICLLTWAGGTPAQGMAEGATTRIGGNFDLSASASTRNTPGPIVGVNVNGHPPISCVQRTFDPRNSPFAGQGRRCGYEVTPGPGEEFVNILDAQPCGGTLATIASDERYVCGGVISGVGLSRSKW